MEDALKYCTWIDKFASRTESPSPARLFSYVTCGIMLYACIAINRPTEAAALHQMSLDSRFTADEEIAIKVDLKPTTVTILKSRGDETQSSLSLVALAYPNSSDPGNDEGNRRRRKKPKKKEVVEAEEGDFSCDIESCSMTFIIQEHLIIHKQNMCLVCGLEFRSHEYLMQHRHVHSPDRPVK